MRNAGRLRSASAGSRPAAPSAHRADRHREALHIISAEVDLVAEFVRMLPPLAAMDMASHLGLIKRTLAGIR